jgi:hypothetical protein
MRANRRDQRSRRFGAQLSVPRVVDDEPRCRDDPRALQHGVNPWEVRSAELVGENRETDEGADVSHDRSQSSAVQQSTSAPVSTVVTSPS